MPYRLDLPKGGYILVDDDIPREEALERAAKDFPDRFPGMGEQIARLPLELLKGVGMTGVQTVGGITALPYTGARALFPSLTPYEETGLGKAIASAEESLAPGYGTAAQVAGGLGQFAGMFGPQALLRGVGGAGRLATGIAPRAAAPVGIAQAGGAGAEQARLMALEAKAQGVEVSPGQEFAALLGGAGIGQLELLPVERLLRGLPGNLDEPFKYNIINLLKRGATQGGTEGAQEVASGLLQELSAKGIYNPNLEVGESMYDDFTMGAGVGSIAQLGLDVLFRKDIKGRYAQRERQKREEEVQRKTDELLKQEREQIEKTKSELGIETPVDPETGKPILALPAPAPPMVKEEGPDPILNPLGFFSANDLRPEAVAEINKVRESLGQAKLTQFSIEDIVDALGDVGVTNKVAQAEVDRLITGKLAEKGVDVDLETQISAQDIVNIAQSKGIDTDSIGFNDFMRRTTGTDNLSKMSLPQKFAAVNAIQTAPENLGILPQATNATRFTKAQYKKAVDNIKKTFPQEGRLGRSQVIKEIKDFTGLENDRDAESLLNTAIRNDEFTTITTPLYEVLDPDGVIRRYNTRQSAEAAADRVNGTVKETSSVDVGLPGSLKELPGGPDIRKGVFEAGEAPNRFDITSNGQTFASAKTQEEADAKVERLQAIRDRKAKELEGAVASIQNQIQKANAKLEEMEAAGQANTIEYAKASAGINANNQKLQAKLESLNNEIVGFRTPLEVKAGPSKKVGREGFTLFKDGVSAGTFPTQQAAEEAAIQSYDLPMLERIAKYGDEQRGLMPKRLAAMARNEIKRRAEGKPGIEVSVSKETQKGRTEQQAKEEALKNLEEAGVYTEQLQKKIAELEKKLLPLMQRMGLKDVGLRIMSAIKAGGDTADGAYANKLIEISLSAADPIGTLRHEAIHALKELGFFKPNEWKILEKRAKEQWINQFLKSRKTGDGRTLFDAYMEQYDGDMEIIIEEAIAEAFRFAPQGITGGLSNKIRKFFDALGNAFQGLGFKTADDVFSNIEMGRLKKIDKQEAKIDSKKYRILAEEPKISKSKNVVFEVAPDPNNEELSSRWNKLDNNDKIKISKDIGDKISSDVLNLFESEGKIFDQVGSYMDDTNPSFAIDIKKGDPVEIAKSLGFALSQDSMMVISGEPGEGLDEVPVISIKLNDDSIEGVNRIYQKLRTIEVDGKKPIEGQTTFNGYMTILNYSDVNNQELAELVDKALLGLWDITQGKAYAAFPTKKEYDYASERDDEGRGYEKIRARSRSLRAEANRLLDDAITGEAARPDEPSVRSSDSSGIILSEELQPEAISLNGIHYSNQPNIPTLAKNFYGRGIKGAEAMRVFQSSDPRIKNRVYFYVPLANGKYPNREVGLGDNVYTQRFRNILGSGPAMTEFWNKSDQDPNKFESLIIDAGYDGYAPYDMGMVVLLNHDVPVNYQGVGVKPEDIKKWSIRSAPLENDILSKVAKDLDLTPQQLAATSLGLQTGLGGTKAFKQEKIGTKKEVINFLQNRYLESGLKPLNLKNEEDRELLSNLLAAEALAAIRTGDANAEWYDQVINKMLGMASLKYPELKSDPNARAAFRISIAVSSQGMNVEDNLKFGEKVYNEFKQNQEKGNPQFPEIGVGESLQMMKKNYRFANLMIQRLGMDDFRRFLETPFTAKEFKDAGFTIDELVDEKILGSSIFGPKIGFGFYSNLAGNFEPVTMDMWFMRTIGRLSGNLKAFNQKKYEDQLKTFRGHFNSSGENGLYGDTFSKQELDRAFTNEEAAIQIARKLKSLHEKDFKENRKLFDSKKRVKTKFVNSAENIIKSLDESKDSPANGGERQMLRDVFRRMREKVAKITGEDIPPASLQAIIWYPEQELYKALGAKLRVTSQNYAGSMRKLLEEEGFDGKRISAAAQSGSRRARRADAGDVGRAAGKDGRQVGKSLSDEEKSGVLAGLKEAPIAEKKKSEKKFALALGMVEPETRLTPTSNPDPDGILAFSPQRSPLRGNPIVMKIGSQSGVQFRGKEMFDVDTGFGATHILTRIIDDPKRTPVGGEELLEQIVLDAQKIATDFNTIYVGNGGNLILHNSNTQDSLIVKPQKDEVSIVSMFKQSGVKKFGNPIWTGKNTQPQREAFIGKISGMDVIAQGNRVISKPAEVKKKVVTPLNIANLANEAIPAPKPGKLTLKKPAQKLSLRSTDTPEFKKWFGDSKIVNKDGTPKVMYHGTARDITEFRPKQANAIFVTDKPRFAGDFSVLSSDYMIEELFDKTFTPEQRLKMVKETTSEMYKEGEISKDFANQVVKLQSTFDKSFRNVDGIVSDELRKKLYAMLPSGENIMPLFVKAENPFDYDNKSQVEKVTEKLKENDPEYYQRNVSMIFKNIASGRWNVIEDSEVQTAIKDLGFDSFYVKENEVKNLAVYKPNQIKSAVGNIGTFRAETGDIRYSIRDNLGTDVADAIDRTTTKRQEEGFAQKVAQALSPLGFARLRQQFVNRYEGIERQSNEIAQQFGDAELLADQSAIAAALMSDRASGVAAEAFRNGVPVYDRGFTYVDNLNGQVKGLIPIFEPLMRFNDPYIFQAFQFYAGTKRGKRLTAEGRERLFTADDIRRGELLGRQYPVFEQVFNDFQDFNKQVVKYMVDTGVISAEMGVKWTENSDYIPFYRQMEGERTAGPNIFSSFANVVKPKKLKGGEAQLDDFLETVIRNTRSAIEAGMKNVAQQRVIRDAVRLGTASPLPAGARMGPDVTTVRVDGKDKHFIVDDPLLIESLKGLNLPRLPFLDVLAAPSRFLREMVTRDPGFIIANLFRDSVSSWVTTGTNIRPVADTFKQYGKVLAGLSPEATALARAGIGTGYEFAGDVKASTEAFTKELEKKAGQKTLAQKALMPVSAMWDALEKGSTASDVATRAEVYKRVLEETGNEAEAIYQAMEVINFSRMGSSPIIQIASALIPFFNARVQGLDVLYRAGFGRAASARKDRQQKAFLTRSLAILALSSLYWWLASDQEEWERAEPEQRDNNWIIGPVKLPIPFEIGTVFKVFPERILEYFFGDDTSKDLYDSFVRNLTSTMAVNPIPQAVLPIIENVANYSFFTGQPIVGKGLEDVADPYQISSSTSLFAKKLGETTGFSPVKLDNLIRGYTGTLGTYGTMLIDEIIRTESDPTKPSLSIERVPVLKRFIATKEGTGTVSAFYDMKNRVDEAVRTVNALERTGDYKNLIEYQKENGKLLAMKDYIRSMERDMKDLRDSRRQVLVSRMDPDLKNDALENIRKAEIALTSRMQYIKKVVD